MEFLLEGRGISKYYGGVAAINHVNLTLKTGEILGLIGPNGSGKTTLLDCLNRIQNMDSGQVFFKGIEITHKKPYQVAQMGLARTFQMIRIYRKLTAFENMVLSRQWYAHGLAKQFHPSPSQIKNRAQELLEFLRISQLIYEPAGHLSWGQQRLLEFGMALMPDPDILLLDEATSGVNQSMINILKEKISFLNLAKHKTFVLIEHNIQIISDLCNRVIILDQGKKLAEGAPEKVLNNKRVVSAYFNVQNKNGHNAKTG